MFSFKFTKYRVLLLTAWLVLVFSSVPAFSEFSESEDDINDLLKASVPAKYDLRTRGKVTGIKDQGTWNTSWAFAALGSLESTYKADFSEMHLAYFTYGDNTGPGKSFTYDTGSNILSAGGNSDQAIAFLSRMGVAYENTLPYPSGSSYTPPNKSPEEYTVPGIMLKDVYKLGTLNNSTAINDVKTLITTTGAVKASFYSDENSYYSGSGFCVYFDNTHGKETNCDIDIIGWDDDFPVSNFPAYNGPAKKGAWLIRNSRGKDWGNDGCFWMSYEQYIDDAALFIADKAEDNLKHYGYDELGATGNVNTTIAANIFKAEDDEILQYVGFYNGVKNDLVNIYVYDLGTEKPSSPTKNGKLMLKARAPMSSSYPVDVKYPGYHIHDFRYYYRYSDAKYITKIRKGHYFSVVVNTVMSASFVEKPVNSHAQPVCNPGESYQIGTYSPSYASTAQWLEMDYNACIKAFTVPDPGPEESKPLSFTGNVTNGTVKSLYSSTFKVTGGSERSYAYEWTCTGDLPPGLSFRPDSSLSGQEADIYGTPTTAGSYNFSITVKDCDNNTFTRNFNVKINTIQGDLNITGDLPVLFTEEPYSATLTASGGSGSYIWTAVNFPDWLTLTPSSSKAVISGTSPKLTGYTSMNLGIKITDSNNQNYSYTKTFTLDIQTLLKINDTFPNGSKNNYYYKIINLEGGRGSYTWSKVDESAIPPGLKLECSGTSIKLSGVAETVGTYEIPLSVKDSENLTLSKTLTVTIDELPAKTLTLKGAFADGMAGYSYRSSVSVTGGTPPYYFAYNFENLPLGLLFGNIPGNNYTDYGYELSGSPSGTGSFTFTVYVVDSKNIPASKTYTINIQRTSSAQLEIKGLLAKGEAGKAYSCVLEVEGGTGPYKWENLTSLGTYPAGLSITQSYSGSVCTISVPKPAKGNYYPRIKVTDSKNTYAMSAFPLIIGDEASEIPVINSDSKLPEGTEKEAYNAKIDVSGGTEPYTWELASSPLPSGLRLDRSSGAITGTPLKAGTYNFSIRVTDSKKLIAVKEFAIKINAAEPEPEPLVITGTLVNTTQNTAYSRTLTASGGTRPYTWQIEFGALPDGLKLYPSDKTASIGGTAVKSGKFTFAIKLTDSAGAFITENYVIDILPAQEPEPEKKKLAINGTLTDSTKGAKYSKTLSVTGGAVPYKWSYTGKLPTGLKITSANKNGTSAALSGTTNTTGTYTFTLKVSDKNGLTGEKSFILKVTQLALTGTFPGGAAKKSYSNKLTASGGLAPYKWSYTGKFPAGLRISFSGANATLAGTPTTRGKYSFTLKLTDKNNISISKVYSINIASAPVLSGTFKAASAGKNYSGRASVSGGTSPYTWSYAGTLPPGLTFASGVLKGIPTTAGRFTFTIKLTDKNGVSASKSFSVTVTKPIISGAFMKSGTLNKNYSSSIRVSGGTSPYKWSKSSGTYPTGLKFSYSGTTARLTGKPTRAGEYTFTIKVTDKNGGIDTKSFTITIPSAASNNKSAVSPSITGALANGTVKKYYSQSIKATGGTASYTWTKSAGTLPTGLRLSSSGSTARIYGTPSKAGTFSFTLKVTDKNKKTATKKFTVKIASASSAKTAKTAAAKALSIINNITARTAVKAVHDNNYIHVNKIALDIVNGENIISRGSEHDEDLITVKADKPIKFIIREYKDSNGNKAALSDLRVFIDFKYDANIDVSESGAFTIPSELVKGDFTVSVKGVYQGLEAESEEFYIEAQ